jgi:hypothetical protein
LKRRIETNVWWSFEFLNNQHFNSLKILESKNHPFLSFGEKSKLNSYQLQVFQKHQKIKSFHERINKKMVVRNVGF